MVKQKSGGGLRACFSTDTTAIWPHELSFNKHILGGGPGEIKQISKKMPPRPGMGIPLPFMGMVLL